MATGLKGRRRAPHLLCPNTCQTPWFLSSRPTQLRYGRHPSAMCIQGWEDRDRRKARRPCAIARLKTPLGGLGMHQDRRPRAVRIRSAENGPMPAKLLQVRPSRRHAAWTEDAAVSSQPSLAAVAKRAQLIHLLVRSESLYWPSRLGKCVPVREKRKVPDRVSDIDTRRRSPSRSVRWSFAVLRHVQSVTDDRPRGSLVRASKQNLTNARAFALGECSDHFDRACQAQLERHHHRGRVRASASSRSGRSPRSGTCSGVAAIATWATSASSWSA